MPMPLSEKTISKYLFKNMTLAVLRFNSSDNSLYAHGAGDWVSSQSNEELNIHGWVQERNWLSKFGKNLLDSEQD
ncbi:hypothetical protein VNO78_22420 [Psophocarpus tetragonolobus]|uniref:Uncharacterized protein n=1 Tax=Psophocarpus tetragonolobus TaxID=3891 RepID=A0AAN9S1L6_PSOTE